VFERRERVRRTRRADDERRAEPRAHPAPDGRHEDEAREDVADDVQEIRVQRQRREDAPPLSAQDEGRRSATDVEPRRRLRRLEPARDDEHRDDRRGGEDAQGARPEIGGRRNHGGHALGVESRERRRRRRRVARLDDERERALSLDDPVSDPRRREHE
jgi:hypothetical protein